MSVWATLSAFTTGTAAPGTTVPPPAKAKSWIVTGSAAAGARAAPAGLAPAGADVVGRP
ncbi:MAG: hypothetical protein OEW29_08690 [Acidimicrobiia bacterium]|nr:hypothetical protein [Acidimicrobiia bacterium]